MAPAIIGTAWAVSIAIMIALPTGVCAALVCDQMICSRNSAILRVAVESLAGVPSVIYGLIGLTLLAPWLQSTFGLLTGHTVFSAGMLLAIMILPTLMLISLDAVSAVPEEQTDSARSLGMEWSERLFFVLLPQAWPGIRSGLMLSLGRALGETMAVMLMIGSMDRIPSPWYDLFVPGQTLTSKIGREIGEASFGSTHFSALIFCGLLLAMVSILVSLVAHSTFPARRS